MKIVEKNLRNASFSVINPKKSRGGFLSKKINKQKNRIKPVFLPTLFM